MTESKLSLCSDTFCVYVSDLDSLRFSSLSDTLFTADNAPTAAPAIPKPATIFALSLDNLVLAIVTSASDFIFHMALAGVWTTNGSWLTSDSNFSSIDSLIESIFSSLS